LRQKRCVVASSREAKVLAFLALFVNHPGRNISWVVLKKKLQKGWFHATPQRRNENPFF
jgi:hypothetical protein